MDTAKSMLFSIVKAILNKNTKENKIKDVEYL